MVFRFWGPGAKSADAPAGEGAWPHHPGVLALIEDAVASKRGVFVSVRDQLYVSGLKQPADALVVSRQVQLGLQGFRGTHAAGPVAVSIAIDASGAAIQSTPDAENLGDSTSSSSSAGQAGGQAADQAARQAPEPPHDLVTLLKISKPAQILLTHDLCQQLARIKGLPLKSFPGRFGVYEYLWTGEEKLDLLQSEPQLTLAAVPAAKNKTDAGPATDRQAGQQSGQQAGQQPDRRVKTAEPTESQADMATDGPSTLRRGFQSPRALIAGAVAAVVLVAAIVIGMRWAHAPSANSAPTQVSQPAPAQTSAPAAAATPVSVQSSTPVQNSMPATVEKPRGTASKQTSRSTTHQRAEAEEKRTATGAGSAPGPAANCTLGGNPERFVGLAEQARGRGDYANAIRIFREVLDCDPDNGAAREGLEKATRGEQSEH